MILIECDLKKKSIDCMDKFSIDCMDKFNLRLSGLVYSFVLVRLSNILYNFVG